MVAESKQSELKRLKENVRYGYEYQLPNYKRFVEFTRFVYDTALTEDHLSVLEELDKPEIEYNICEAFISRILGEFSRQIPSVSITNDEIHMVSDQILKTVEGHIQYRLRHSEMVGTLYRVMQDLLAGGFSCFNVYSDWENERSMKQELYLKRVYNPTLVAYDPMAIEPSRNDGNFFYENYPMRKADFKRQYPKVDLDGLKFTKEFEGFNWSYSTGKEDIVLLCNYFEKEKKRTKLLQLANGQSMTSKDYQEMMEKWNANRVIEQPSAVINERMTDLTTIVRYQLIENQIIDYRETNYKSFPYKWVSGNGKIIQKSFGSTVQMMERPYVYNAKGVQQLQNFSAQTLANELENMVQSKYMIPEEGIPKQYKEALTNYQKSSVIVYNQFSEDHPDERLDQPKEIMRQNIPAEVMGAYQSCMTMMQNTLGVYDASLGINDNQLSGKAIVKGSTQSNAAAQPYTNALMLSLTDALQMMVDLLPTIYVEPRVIPYLDSNGQKQLAHINPNEGQEGVSFYYEPLSLKVSVKADVATSIQKAEAIQQMAMTSQAFPLFQQFMGQYGLNVIMDNLDFRGIDTLKEQVPMFMQMVQQQQQQASQSNPLLMKAHLESAKLMQKAQDDEQKNQIEVQKTQLAKQDITNDTIKIMMDANMARDENAVQLAKAQTEREVHGADIHLRAHKQVTDHLRGVAELSHKINSEKEVVQNPSRATP